MLRRLHTTRGMSLIELTVVIVVIGILTAVAMKSMTGSLEDLRRLRTERELQQLVKAIVGDASQASDRHRTDFGYIGDVGAFPPNLAALVINPGYAAWKGPYIRTEYAADTIGYRLDEWGKPYTYSGVTVVSSGNGTPISVKLADAASDYLLNQYYAQVLDVNDSMPGAIKKDSTKVLVTIPNGVGTTITKMYRPDLTGTIGLDSLPVGQHRLRVIYEPENDTIDRYITVLPRHKTLLPTEIKFSRNYFAAVLNASLTKITGSDSISAYSPSCDGLSFWIRNNTGATRTVSSIKLTFASPTAYYRYVKWNGTLVVSSNSPRVGSSQAAMFSSAMTLAYNQAVKIEVESFKSSASGGGGAVNMQNSTFTVEFSDGSVITVTTGACN